MVRVCLANVILVSAQLRSVAFAFSVIFDNHSCHTAPPPHNVFVCNVAALTHLNGGRARISLPWYTARIAYMWTSQLFEGDES